VLARTVVEIAGSVTAHLDGNDQSFNWFSAPSLVAIGRDSDLQLTVILAGRRF